MNVVYVGFTKMSSVHVNIKYSADYIYDKLTMRMIAIYFRAQQSTIQEVRATGDISECIAHVSIMRRFQ